jgi:rubrerythrin
VDFGRRRVIMQMTLQQVLEEAINKEVMSRFLYIGLRQRVHRTEVKEAFQNLAEEEENHQRIIEQYSRGKLREGVLDTGMVVDYKIAEHLDQPEITPTMDLQEVFALASRKEKASAGLYQSLAAIHPPGQVRQLLEKLAEQELGHAQRVEKLYTEVAFPQTDGG